MYNLTGRSSVLSKKEKGLSTSNILNQINVSYILIVIFVLIIFCRGFGVIDKYRERGAHPYIQLLNIGMPIVGTQIYDESEFVENDLSLKTIFLEAFGLYNINSLEIVGKEISLFKGSYDNTSTSKGLSKLIPFNLKDDSIARMTPEEIAELNAESPAYDSTLKKQLDNSKPEVLIYSTHTTEGYAEGGQDTVDNSFNVIGVAEVLAKELEEKYGISVIHDKTNHTLSGYNSSYNRAKETVNSYLDKYGDFKLIIDVHRDSVGNNKQAVTTNINGQDLAKTMFVTAQNSGRYGANKALTDKLYNISESLFPGLSRNIWEYKSGKLSIHQELSNGALLIEFGANINSAQEAKLSAKYMARILAEHLNR